MLSNLAHSFCDEEFTCKSRVGLVLMPTLLLEVSIRTTPLPRFVLSGVMLLTVVEPLLAFLKTASPSVPEMVAPSESSTLEKGVGGIFY